MHTNAAVLPEHIQQVVNVLLAHGVVCKTNPAGEPLFELYSLLDALCPEEQALAVQLQQVRLLPWRFEDLDAYLLYVSLPDLLAHLLPVSTLPEAEAFQQYV